MTYMIDLVRKRHDGDGWIVFQELGNRPGYPDRYADAVAISVWASKKYEAHLYEFKVDRNDVKREIKDPTKVEGVGQYCTYWWLVVDDEKRIKDLVIPEAWGILLVKPHGADNRLVTIRKAPRQKPKPIGLLLRDLGDPQYPPRIYRPHRAQKAPGRALRGSTWQDG